MNCKHVGKSFINVFFVSSAGLFQHLGWVFNIYTKLNIFSSYIQSLNTEYNVAIFFIDVNLFY